MSGLALVNPVINITDPRMQAPAGAEADHPVAGRDRQRHRPARARSRSRTTGPRCAPLHSQTRLWAGWCDAIWTGRPAAAGLPLAAGPRGRPVLGAADHGRVRSTDVEVISLERSYHVATLDYEDELIFAGSAAMFRRLAKE